jgi:hypothetical protein
MCVLLPFDYVAIIERRHTALVLDGGEKHANPDGYHSKSITIRSECPGATSSMATRPHGNNAQENFQRSSEKK